jgi:hypothetical protein
MGAEWCIAPGNSKRQPIDEGLGNHIQPLSGSAITYIGHETRAIQ